MEAVFLIGRIILGGFFIMSGMKHFTNFAMMKDYSASKGAPLPGASVAGTGTMLLLGGLSLLLGVCPEVGVILLVLFLLGASFIMHNFWAVKDAQARAGEMVNFMKNFALIGALLMILAIPQPWAFSWFSR
jgi:putative oxidoreductase